MSADSAGWRRNSACWPRWAPTITPPARAPANPASTAICRSAASRYGSAGWATRRTETRRAGGLGAAARQHRSVRPQHEGIGDHVVQRLLLLGEGRHQVTDEENDA